jgi:2-polyprenyl-6-methoxyphenol hydroxylase-like FAD-dependent oxidoreductase
MVALASVEQTCLVPIRTSVPVPGWTPSRVTLLGDAIHAMSPARGSGANTALQDAALLCRTLTAAAPDGSAPDGPALVAAIGEYESQMREYGYAAVRTSLQAQAEMGSEAGGVMLWLQRSLARGRAGAS